MSTTQAPPRARYEVGPWSLDDLIPDRSEGALAALLEDLENAVRQLEARRESLDPAMEPGEFLDVLRLYESFEEKMSGLSGYSSLWFSSDTQSAEALAFRNHMQQVLTQLGNRVLFLDLWWQGLADNEAERLRPQGPEHGDFRHYLDSSRLFKPYMLDEASEQIVNIKDANGIAAIVTLYQMLTSRLEFEVEIDGESQTLTDGEARSLFFSPDPQVRSRTYQEIYRVYGEESNVLGQIYANRVRDWHSEYVELRGFKTPIAIRNLSNDVPDAAVDTLLEVASSNAGLFQEYFRLKAGWLGMEKLRRYDMYAPLAAAEKNTDWDQAVTSVLDTFHAFDPRFGQLAQRVFDEQHIDSEIRKGKKSGAFCATLLPRLTPWVHLSYSGRLRDVATLAHELGHAIHSMMASDHSLLTLQASLPLAETASVFAEMLMTDRLLAEEQDPTTRRELLAAAMDDIYATVIRQAFFVRFERDAHRAIMGNCSSDELCDMYMANLEEQFGDSLEIPPEFRYEWLSIPHMFNSPFYCYAYSFGQLLVLALYRRYQQEGDAFKPGYFRLLSYGGSAKPERMLAELGIDIADPEFWQGGFDVARDLLDDLKAI